MIDISAYLGHFAFRPLRHNTAAGLLAYMDRRGIAKAVVGSASALTYRNAHAGNQEMAAEIKGHADRLIPFAVLNPAYAGWQDDLKVCQDQFGMRGVRLYPRWHNYKLSDPACLELVRAAAARGMLVSLTVRVEDRRQGSWLADIPDLTNEEIAALIRAVPQATFIVANGMGLAGSPLGNKDSGLPANYVIDTGRIGVELDNEMARLIANLGEDRLVLGTGMPFQYPDIVFTRLDMLDAPESVKQKIREGNAVRLLRL